MTIMSVKEVGNVSPKGTDIKRTAVEFWGNAEEINTRERKGGGGRKGGREERRKRERER